SGYFLANGKPYDEFMRQNWVPLLIGDEPPRRCDERHAPNALAGIMLWSMNNAEPVKLVIYLIIIATPALIYYKLYQTAEGQRQQALRQHMIALAHLADTIDRPDTAVLVSVEANRGVTIKEARETLVRQLERIAAAQ